jgi:hypothetical protein
MNIRLQGFRLRLIPELPLRDLVARLSSLAEKPVMYGGHNRVVAVQDGAKYLVGSVWTFRGQKKITQIHMRSLKKSIRELEKDHSVAAFTFFIISKRNLNGLFSYYHGSFSLSSFGEFLALQARQAAKSKRDQELRALPPGQQKIQRKRIREKYADPLEWSHLISGKKLSEIIASWKRLKNLQYRITHLEASGRDLGGLQAHVKARTTKLTFDPLSPVKEVIVAVLNHVRGIDYKSASLEGIDETGSSRIVNLLNTPDWFGELQESAILNDSTLFSDNLLDICVVKKLLEVAEKHPEYFNIDVK